MNQGPVVREIGDAFDSGRDDEDLVSAALVAQVEDLERDLERVGETRMRAVHPEVVQALADLLHEDGFGNRSSVLLESANRGLEGRLPVW